MEDPFRNPSARRHDKPYSHRQKAFPILISRMGLEETQDFSRYEFKYLLDADLRAQVESEIANFMRFDGFAHPELDNAYIVRSLYFDDDDRTHYYEKIDGQLDRRKYRIRTYAKKFEANVPIFLELKGRYNQRVYKRRSSLDPADLPVYLDPLRLSEFTSGEGNAFLEAFIYASLRRRLSPLVLVDYIRRPYVSDYDMNFRVTFDSDLRATVTGELFPDDSPPWLLCEPGRTIVEFKFNRRIPAWFHRIVQAYGLRRLSISKFCRGMEITGLATRLE